MGKSLKVIQKIMRLLGHGPTVDDVAHLDQRVPSRRPVIAAVDDLGVSQDLLQGRRFAMDVTDRDCFRCLGGHYGSSARKLQCEENGCEGRVARPFGNYARKKPLPIVAGGWISCLSSAIIGSG